MELNTYTSRGKLLLKETFGDEMLLQLQEKNIQTQIIYNKLKDIANLLITNIYLSNRLRIQELKRVYNILIIDNIVPFYGEIDFLYVESNKKFIKYYKDVKKTLEKENTIKNEYELKYKQYGEEYASKYNKIQEWSHLLFGEKEIHGGVFGAGFAGAEDGTNYMDLKMCLLVDYKNELLHYINYMENISYSQKKIKIQEKKIGELVLKYDLCINTLHFNIDEVQKLPEDVFQLISDYVGDDFKEKIRKSLCINKYYGNTIVNIKETLELMLNSWRVRDLLNFCDQLIMQMDIYTMDFFPSYRRERKSQIIEFIMNRKIIKKGFYDLYRDIAIITRIIRAKIAQNKLRAPPASPAAAETRIKKTRAESI